MSNNKKLYFRCDATFEIGSGHVLRCLALADTMRDARTEIVFFCRSDVDDLQKMIEERGYEIVLLPRFQPILNFDSVRKFGSKEQIEFERTDIEFMGTWLALNIVKKPGTSIVLLVDHYMLGLRWQSLVKSFVDKLVVIDDLLDIPHEADIVIDPNIRTFSERDSYIKTLSESCDYFGGSDYLFIRRSMEQCRLNAVKRIEACFGIRNILVMFGGSDSSNCTRIAIEGCLGMPETHVHVILGINNMQRTSLEALFGDNDRITIHPFVEEPGYIMSMCDVSVGALGTTTWERCFLGLPALVFTSQPSQRTFLKFLDAQKIVVDIGLEFKASELTGKLMSMAKSNNEYRDLRRHVLSFIDGRGLQRMQEKIYEH